MSKPKPRSTASRVPTRWVIAVDGPAGAGKSSAARGLARTLGFRHIDTGAMYRAAAWAALRAGVPLDAEKALIRVVGKTRFDFTDGATRVDGVDVAGAIRTPEVAGAASAIAVRPRLRKILVDRQRRMGRGGGVVM
ncbi:MAG TPA: (d)CMP kinase, partial [Elusimicrobiota bacterium]|nr:(d)CMP kinase [Elusimicrobiota bacterium]